VNDDVLARIRKLLALAEHPATPEGEAEAAERAAERLIAKYAIDEVLLEAASPTRSRPELRTVLIDKPYASAKAVLLGAVASAHGVRAISHRGEDPPRVTLVGFASDLRIVDLLYTSLLLQATTALRRRPDTGRGFRRSFLVGFASEVGQRLQAAKSEAIAAAGPASTALALRNRDQEVEAATRAEFPGLRTSRTTVSDRRGLMAGRESGAAANLSSGGNQVDNHRRALGS
jgi:Protein of unknown function (DUF2786)